MDKITSRWKSRTVAAGIVLSVGFGPALAADMEKDTGFGDNYPDNNFVVEIAFNGSTGSSGDTLISPFQDQVTGQVYAQVKLDTRRQSTVPLRWGPSFR